MFVEFFDDLKTVVQMIADRIRGRYRELPWYCIVILAFALVYAVCPLNWIPVVGALDDVAVVYLCLKLIGPELAKYREWRKAGEASADLRIIKEYE